MPVLVWLLHVHMQYLGVVCDVLGAGSYDTDSLHAGIWERSVAGKLRQTLHRIVEGVDGSHEMLLEYLVWRQEQVLFILGYSLSRAHGISTWR